MLRNAPPLQVSLARSDGDLRAAQRLRYDVFVKELGADGPLVDHRQQLECDAHDGFADHLILRDMRLVDRGRDGVVGVYRLMARDQAERAGGFYSEAEFDLGPLHRSGRRIMELSRSCLHPDYRGGPALMALWQGLVAQCKLRDIDLLFGVASFYGTDLARHLNAISHLHHAHLAHDPLCVRSRMPQPALLPPDRIDRKSAMRDTPALIKSYLRIGGRIGQGVYIDHAFNTTDICLILDIARMPSNTLLQPPDRAAS